MKQYICGNCFQFYKRIDFNISETNKNLCNRCLEWFEMKEIEFKKNMYGENYNNKINNNKDQ